MSVRAYKLLEIKHEEEPTFSCYDFNFGAYGDASQYSDGGLVTFQRYELETALAENECEDYERDIIQAILDDMGDEDAITYYCF